LKQVRVIVVDDSAVVRGLLVRALQCDPAIVIAGTAMHGEQALRQLREHEADVVVLDVEMPVMDGLTALPIILAEFPRVRVIMASALTQEGAEPTVRALALGAAACIAKPVANRVSESVDLLVTELVPLVKALGGCDGAEDGVTEVAGAPKPESSGKSVASPHLPIRHWKTRPAPIVNIAPELIVIGSSTGGPNALTKVLSSISPDVFCPILIVQHMPPAFTPMLAKHLQKDSGRPCQEATHGGPIERGHIYVAPGDFHMSIDTLDGHRITLLSKEAPQHFCRPSVNPLFSSAARWSGRRTLAIMLTGMGDDGIEATHELAQVGAYIIAQDEATSVVWGMPAAVAKAGLANEILPLDKVGPAISRLCTRELVLQ
jgi:two-component system, chemotaxis family, protein-glutamate methylesterase/glutaminase